ncbi:MAG: Crp/Fnr family transcriptional regulator [Solirubrobacterales bacterium]
MEVISLLSKDPDLATGIPAEKLALAQRACAVRALEARRGDWDWEENAAVEEDGGYGLLVLSGLLCRRVVQGQRYGAELLGPGDLLRPWDKIGEWSSIPTDADWLVIEDARLAILDGDFTRRIAPFPQIGVALIRRGMLRSRYLAMLIAVVSQRRVETRLTMLFWHLADRFGRMRGEWIEIPVPLTHRLLAEFVAARRPSVSTALAKLQEQGVLTRYERGWRLHGPVPTEFENLEAPADPLAPAASAATGAG